MRQTLSLFLRLGGPLLQLVCLIGLFARSTARPATTGSLVDNLLYGGFFLGFLMVLAGLLIRVRAPRHEHDDNRAGRHPGL